MLGSLTDCMVTTAMIVMRGGSSSSIETVTVLSKVDDTKDRDDCEHC